MGSYEKGSMRREEGKRGREEGLRLVKRAHGPPPTKSQEQNL
jgi:hypothetical protein